MTNSPWDYEPYEATWVRGDYLQVASGTPVSDWPIEKKIHKAIELSLPRLKPHIQAQLKALLNPRLWWMMVFVAGLLAALAWFYAAIAAVIIPVACAILASYGIAMTVCDGVSDVCNFLYYSATAKTEQDLRRAAEYLAHAAAVGTVNAIPVVCAGVVKAATRYSSSLSAELNQQLALAAPEAESGLARASKAAAAGKREFQVLNYETSQPKYTLTADSMVFRYEPKNVATPMTPHPSPYAPYGKYEFHYNHLFVVEEGALDALTALRKQQGYFEQGVVLRSERLGDLMNRLGSGAVIIEDLKFNMTVVGGLDGRGAFIITAPK
jgi:hypothetical protein